MRAGKSDPDCRTPRRTAPEDLSATTCKAFMATTPAAATVCLTVWDVIVDSWGVDSWNVTGACRPNYWTMVSVVSVDTVASEGAPETWGTFGWTAVSAAVRAVDQPPCTAPCAPSGAAHEARGGVAPRHAEQRLRRCLEVPLEATLGRRRCDLNNGEVGVLSRTGSLGEQEV